MRKLQPLIIAIMLVIVLGIAFYWYEWKPSQARKICNERQTETMLGLKDSNLSDSSVKFAVDLVYKKCLAEYGVQE